MGPYRRLPGRVGHRHRRGFAKGRAPGGSVLRVRFGDRRRAVAGEHADGAAEAIENGLLPLIGHAIVDRRSLGVLTARIVVGIGIVRHRAIRDGGGRRPTVGVIRGRAAGAVRSRDRGHGKRGGIG